VIKRARFVLVSLLHLGPRAEAVSGADGAERDDQ
jgi:hypothetical protein